MFKFAGVQPMWVINIVITNFVLDCEIHYKTIGPFSSADAADAWFVANKEKIDREIRLSENYESDDDWVYDVKEVFAP